MVSVRNWHFYLYCVISCDIALVFISMISSPLFVHVENETARETT